VRHREIGSFQLHNRLRPRSAVKLFRRLAIHETNFLPEEAICHGQRRRPETIVWQAALVKQRSSTMSAIVSLLYRAFCMSRLVEMRKYHLSH
jgi:hypothetical protein